MTVETVVLPDELSLTVSDAEEDGDSLLEESLSIEEKAMPSEVPALTITDRATQAMTVPSPKLFLGFLGGVGSPDSGEAD